MLPNSGDPERRRGTRRHGRRPNGRRTPYIDTHQHDKSLPKDFFCPISKKFMYDPVNIRGSHLTYDRDSVKHQHKPEDALPDLRMRKRMDVWFSQYTNDPPFDSISTRGFLLGSAISVVKQRKESLLSEFARAIKQKPWLLMNGGGMLCVTTLLTCQRPSFFWVTTALSIVAHVDYEENLLLPANIYPDYSLLDPIKEALEFEAEATNVTVDFKPGFANFMHGLVMSTSNIIFMEGKMGGIVEALVRNMWPVPQIFGFNWYQKQLATLESLSESDEFCERMFNSEVIWMSLLVIDSGLSSIEGIPSGEPPVAASLAIATCMRILENVCDLSPRARTQLREKVLHELPSLCKALSGHLKVVEDHVEGSDVLAQFLGEPRKPFRIDVRVYPRDSP